MVKMVKRKRGSEKTGFEHFLKMDMQKDISAEDDLKWERKLAKKLGVKDGKLRGMDDGVRSLFEEIPSAIDSLGEEVSDAQKFSTRCSVKKRKKLRLVVETSGNDVALEQVSIKISSQPVKTTGSEVVMEKKVPAREENIKCKAPYLRSCEGNGLEQYHQLRRQIRGLFGILSMLFPFPLPLC